MFLNSNRMICILILIIDFYNILYGSYILPFAKNSGMQILGDIVQINTTLSNSNFWEGFELSYGFLLLWQHFYIWNGVARATTINVRYCYGITIPKTKWFAIVMEIDSWTCWICELKVHFCGNGSQNSGGQFHDFLVLKTFRLKNVKIRDLGPPLNMLPFPQKLTQLSNLACWKRIERKDFWIDEISQIFGFRSIFSIFFHTTLNEFSQKSLSHAFIITCISYAGTSNCFQVPTSQ